MATFIPYADPTLAAQSLLAAGGGGGGGGGGAWPEDVAAQTNNTPAPAPTSTNKPLNTAAIANTQLAIDQLPAILKAALDAEAASHQNVLNTFDQQEQGQRKTYDTSSTTNQQNYDSNFMDSIRAGIQGLAGLRNLLRGSGAGGGTAEDQVHDVVGGVTANDIRGGADTRDQNQTSLDSALSSFLTELKGKRQQNEDTYVNNTHAIQRDNATQMQDLFGKMAGFYGDAGDTAHANEYMARAGELTPTIAANSQNHVSTYDTAPVAVTAPQLTAFADPSQPNVVQAPQNGQVGSGIFTINNRRNKDQQTTPVAIAQGA